LPPLPKTLRRAANLLLATPPTFVVTGTGRSGTGYAAQRLSGLGIACSHESYFTPGGIRLRDPDRPFGTKGDASWLAPPLLATMNIPVVHLVRSPAQVIYSLYSIGFFDPEFLSQHRPFLAFAARHFHVGNDPIDACIRWWLEWNRRCEAVATLRVPIEKFEERLPQLIAHIGLAPSRRGEPPSVSYNKRPSVYPRPLSRAEVERRIWAHPLAPEIANMARRYGYVAPEDRR
jgi:hypothetical protein